MPWHIILTPSNQSLLQVYLYHNLEAMECCFLTCSQILIPCCNIQATTMAVLCPSHPLCLLHSYFSVLLLLLHQHHFLAIRMLHLWQTHQRKVVIQDNTIPTMFTPWAQVPHSCLILSCHLFIHSAIHLWVDAFQRHLVPSFLIQIITNNHDTRYVCEAPLL